MRLTLNPPKVNLIVSALRFTAMRYEDMARDATHRMHVREATEYGQYALALATIADEFADGLPHTPEFSSAHVKGRI